MFKCTVLLSVFHAVLVGGRECPSDPGLKRIIESVTKNVVTSELEGTWMDVVIPAEYIETVDSSFTVYEAEEDGKTVKLSGHDFLKSGKIMEYTFALKKKDNGIKGAYTYEGTYVSEDAFKKDAYFFYVDKHVIGFYTCDPDTEIEDGWDLFILVNADKKKELQEQKETSEVMKSLKKAKDVMKSMEEQNNLWLKDNKESFGLMGTMKEFNLNMLQTEVIKDEPGSGSIQDQDEIADKVDEHRKVSSDIHNPDVPTKDLGETIKSQNNDVAKINSNGNSDHTNKADKIDEHRKMTSEIHSPDVPTKDLGETIKPQNTDVTTINSNGNKAHTNTQVSSTNSQNKFEDQKKYGSNNEKYKV